MITAQEARDMYYKTSEIKAYLGELNNQIVESAQKGKKYLSLSDPKWSYTLLAPILDKLREQGFKTEYRNHPQHKDGHCTIVIAW